MVSTLTPEQVSLIKSTVPVLEQHANRMATVFYQSLIGEKPGLRDLFSSTSQTTGRQPRALATSVLAYATHIEDLPALSHAVSRIAHKHVSLGVSSHQYAVVGRHLMTAIGQVLGDAATPAVVDAWTAAYGVLADLLIGLEEAMYRTNKTEHGWQGWRKVRVARKMPETDSIVSFYLEPVDGPPLPPFLPGQYVSLRAFVPSLGHLQSRQYSLSAMHHHGDRGAPPQYRVSVKRETGPHPAVFSNMLHDRVVVGDLLEAAHPQGEFFLDPHDPATSDVPVVLISAGIGASPLMAILESLTAREGTSSPAVRRPVTWVSAARSRAQQPFADEIRRICKANDNVRQRLFLSTNTIQDQSGEEYHFVGRLDLKKLHRESDLHLNNVKSQYYICGPEQFMIDLRTSLLGMGVSKDRVHMELFETGDVADSSSI